MVAGRMGGNARFCFFIIKTKYGVRCATYLERAGFLEVFTFEKDIRSKYDEVLLKLIGQNRFTRYLEVRDRFNQDLMEKQDPNQGVILMDF